MSVYRLRLTMCVAAFALTVAARSHAQTPAPAPPAPAPAPAPAPTTESTPASAPATPVSGFETDILAGGAVNELSVVDVQPGELMNLPAGTLAWRGCAQPSKPQDLQARTKGASATAGNNEQVATVLTFFIPDPPCQRSFLGLTLSWPVYQDAEIRVEGRTQAAGPARVLFEGTVPVSVRWFPFAIAVLVLGLIYPGCSLVAFYLARRRYRRLPEMERRANGPPSFLGQLDPVQITANTYGRGSLQKLQIFGFSVIVFALLLYYQFRNGILSGLSQDVLFLLGISAVGTVGGRITYAAKRRLSLDNWVWLRRKKWMPSAGEGAARRASWRELIVDPDSNEFDPYSFQMAIFSVVVGIALVSSSVIGLSTFEIPNELLGLLGLSQAVFIAGKAAEKSPFVELDARLTSVRDHERKYQEARASADSAIDANMKADAEGRATSERAAFKNEVGQAADMFTMLFAETIASNLPNSLREAHKLEPEGFIAAPPAPIAPAPVV
jgi:hypothetical protein